LFPGMQVSTWILLIKLAAVTIIKGNRSIYIYRSSKENAVEYALKSVIPLWSYHSGEVVEKFKMQVNFRQPWCHHVDSNRTVSYVIISIKPTPTCHSRKHGLQVVGDSNKPYVKSLSHQSDSRNCKA
jgi:hypothetical protein